MSYFLLPQIPATSLASSLLVLFVCYLLGTGFDLGARAQSLGLPHDCANSSYSWTYNTEGEPPCALATDLLRPCGDLINGPTLLNTPCICNSVLYSLDSACRWCSNEPDTILKFTDFADSFSCTNTVEGQYPETIPPGTPIPAWAYLPLTGDQFDIAGAEQMMLSPGKDPVVPSGPGGNSSPADSSTSTTTSGGSAPVSTTTIVTQHTPSTSGSSQHSSSTSSPAAPGSSESTSSDTSGTNTNDSHNNTTTNSHPSTGNASSNTTTTSSSADGTSTTSNQRTTPASSSPTATNGSNEPSPLPGLPTVAGNASTMTPTGGPGKQSSNHVAAVVGGAAGGVCAVAVLIALGLFLVRRRRRRRHDDGDHGRGIGRRLSCRRRGLPFGPQLETSATQQLRGDDQGVSPTFVFKLYNPDDPSTYPPPLSEIHSDSKLSTYPGGYLEISDAVKV
ncbi:hypothetical protein C8Q70DRAFT_479720 [Cubamyces menziesii]|nr:hypothetical protein C8Q70DRAFT_479720 [Cubamyces menziesii]